MATPYLYSQYQGPGVGFGPGPDIVPKTGIVSPELPWGSTQPPTTVVPTGTGTPQAPAAQYTTTTRAPAVTTTTAAQPGPGSPFTANMAPPSPSGQVGSPGVTANDVAAAMARASALASPGAPSGVTTPGTGTPTTTGLTNPQTTPGTGTPVSAPGTTNAAQAPNQQKRPFGTAGSPIRFF